MFNHLELISQLLLLLLQLVHGLLVPASGLRLQVAGSSGDDSRLLEERPVQGDGLDTHTMGEGEEKLGVCDQADERDEAKRRTLCL